ncbi:arrestin domain-containing protein 17-like [Anopheles maculipalpis]|uniref:arrestin domain-containing protein 17-like n=1 Tax=Anopheles maculipalpis TaxID=1496333 RepID=UPI002158C6C3|nr:arrestin domain-containing protein 17-like [Anopheles maculipalpis]
MASSPACTISFDDNFHGVFFAGQKFTGTVDIDLPKTKKVKGISLKVTGLARVLWTETYGTGTTIAFQGREDFLKHVVVFVRSDTDEPIVMDPGRQVYKFALQLPNSLPTSFEGDYGYIRYTARVIFERPWKFDLTYKIAFTVVNQLNLNTISPPLNVPVVQEHIKHFYCGPCRSEPLTINVMLPMTGYVPGQFVLTTVSISNGSNKCIAEVKLKLRRQVRYCSKTPYQQNRTVYNTLAKFQCSGVDAKGSAAYERRFLVPSEPPTRSDTIIRLEYFVEVTAKVLGMAYSPQVQIPVIIGTVPLMNLNQRQQRASIVEAHMTTTSSLTRKIFHASVPSLAIPHTFEKSAGRVDVNIQDDDESPSLGTVPFTPRYPMYHFDTDNKLATHNGAFPQVHSANAYKSEKLPPKNTTTTDR